MGPQHDSCGRRDERDALKLSASLQWGRNMIVAEGSARPALVRGRPAAFNGAAT